MSRGLSVGGAFTIPDGELTETFDTSGGPGGQHANRANTRVELSFDLERSPSVPDDLRERMLARLGGRVVDGVVTVTADDTRSQWRNRVNARRRLGELLEQAMKPPRTRIPTKPSRRSRRRRLERKRRRSETKRLRKPPRREDW
jgi:ribosome-associated protein